MNTNPDRSDIPLKLSEKAFRALVENAFDVVLIINREGIITYASPSLRFVLGFTPQERVGKSALEFVSADDKDKAQGLLAGVGGRPGAREYTQVEVQHRDGSFRTLEVMGQNLLDDPDVNGIVVNYRDITERLKAIEALRVSEMRYNKAFGVSPDAISINYISSGRFLDVNPAFERMTGYDHDEVIGKTPIDLGLWKDTAQRKEVVERLERGDSVHDYEADFIDKHGDEKTCLVSAERVELGGEPCMLSVARDITMQKAVAIELKRAADHLRADHHELAEKNAALRQILGHLDEEKASYRHDIASNAKSLLAPIVAKLKETGGRLSPKYVAWLEEAMHRIAGEDIDDYAHNMSTLTSRELDIAELIRQGLSSKEIADKLSLSPQTVHKHRRTIRRKLQLDNKGINLAAYLRSRDQ